MPVADDKHNHQHQHRAARMSKLQARPWVPESLPPTVLFINASVIDTVSGTTQHKRNVLISNGLISHISRHDRSSPPEGDPNSNRIVIDLRGKFLVPGLIDCHVHLTATPGSLALSDLFNASPNTIAYRTTYVARTMLLRGFTTARDTGGATIALKSAIAEGLLPGPRLFIAGKALSQTGGHGDARPIHQSGKDICCGGHSDAGLSRVVDGVPACLAAARDELRQGADFIKIMSGGGVSSPADPLEMLQFTPEEIQAIVSCARHRGTYVTAHAYTSEAIRHAVDNGVMGIEHGNFIDAETAQYCADKGVTITPTLITYKGMTQKPFDNFLDEEGRKKNAQVLQSGFESLKILRDAGVMMCYGSDLLAGLHVLQNGEFALRGKVLEPAEVLRSATVHAARLLRMEGKLGVVKENAIADLLVLERNPLEDISVLDSGEDAFLAIIKDGRVVRSEIVELAVDAMYHGVAARKTGLRGRM